MPNGAAVPRAGLALVLVLLLPGPLLSSAENGLGSRPAPLAVARQDAAFVPRNGAPLRGDADGNGSVGVPDVAYLFEALYASGPQPASPCGGDANADSVTGPGDAFFLVSALLGGGPAPANPDATIAAPASVGPLSAGNLAGVPEQSGAAYTWSISGGSITSGSAASQIAFTAGASGTVDLVASVAAAGCTSTGLRSVPITADPRVLPADLTYLGAFRLPEVGARPLTFEYGGNAMTYRPDGDPGGPADGFPGSLFISGHDRMPYGELPDGSRIAEVTIPVPSLSRQRDELAVAQLLQGFQDVTGGLFAGLDEIPRLGAQFLDRPETGPKIHLAWGQHFQPEPAVPTHAWCDPTLSSPGTQGAWFLGLQTPYAVNGYLLEIPAPWAALHTSGRVLGTGRYRDGGWSGMGPALFAYRPWLDAAGTPAPAGSQLPETTLLRYARSDETDLIERCLQGYQHADSWEGAAFLTSPGGKSALLVAGTKGVGARYWYGYLDPRGAELPCVDAAFVGQFEVCRLADGTPCPPADLVECAGHTSARGWWSSQSVARLLLYDVADLAAVADGTLPASSPQPYAHVDIDGRLFLNPDAVDVDELGTGVQRRNRLGDVTYDRARGLLYVLELFGDGARPIVHAFRVP